MKKLLLISSIILTLGAGGAMAEEQGYDDPLEGFNRGVLKFNTAVDNAVFNPVIDGYRYVVHRDIRQRVTDFFRNLSSPIDFANQLLQGDLEGAGNVLFRFTVNTFAGFGGLFDFAAKEGWAYESEDFGQTLAVWGVPDGPYLVVPFFGPASLRDALGYAADGYADPVSQYFDNTDKEAELYTYNATKFLLHKNSTYELLNDQRNNSLDYYASLKNVTYQYRQKAIRDGSYNVEDDTYTIPHYED